jgi:hypothetical protein
MTARDLLDRIDRDRDAAYREHLREVHNTDRVSDFYAAAIVGAHEEKCETCAGYAESCGLTEPKPDSPRSVSEQAAVWLVHARLRQYADEGLPFLAGHDDVKEYIRYVEALEAKTRAAESCGLEGA